MSEIRPIRWVDGRLYLLDQTRLPGEVVVVEVSRYEDAAAAIRDMRVRGAPAIGVTAAYAMVLAAESLAADAGAGMAAGVVREAGAGFAERLERAADAGFEAGAGFALGLERAAGVLRGARPTAVNLGWAVDRMLAAAGLGGSLGEVLGRMRGEAERIHREDEAANRRIGGWGLDLMPDGGSVLTHCNTGALATSGYGTALGVIRAGWEAGKRYRVFNTETRPWLQGARLTSWELQRLGIPATLLADSAAGLLMRQGRIGCVITGADRIAANGDTANKIGTYMLAALARENGIPFYVAAPTSTVDLGLADGDGIEIEERAGGEVTGFGGVAVAPAGVAVVNPAFDVTPHRYISAIVTEWGVARAPYGESLLRAVRGAAGSD